MEWKRESDFVMFGGDLNHRDTEGTEGRPKETLLHFSVASVSLWFNPRSDPLSAPLPGS